MKKNCRLHDLKYTHIIKHRYNERISARTVKVHTNSYLAANVRITPTHIIYESENAWNQVIEMRVPLGDVLEIKEIIEEDL